MKPLAGLITSERILENRCLRLGRRNEEDTRAQFLSKCPSSPTASIILSMMSCGTATEFAIVMCKEVWQLWLMLLDAFDSFSTMILVSSAPRAW